MMGWFKIIKLTCGFDNFVNSGIAEFDNFTGLCTYKMIVLRTLVSLFEL